MIAMLAESGVHYTFECLLQSRGSMGDAGRVDGPSLAQLRRIWVNYILTLRVSTLLLSEYQSGDMRGNGGKYTGCDAGSEMRRSQGSGRHSSKLTAHRKAEVPLLCI